MGIKSKYMSKQRVDSKKDLLVKSPSVRTRKSATKTSVGKAGDGGFSAFADLGSKPKTSVGPGNNTTKIDAGFNT